MYAECNRCVIDFGDVSVALCWWLLLKYKIQQRKSVDLSDTKVCNACFLEIQAFPIVSIFEYFFVRPAYLYNLKRVKYICLLYIYLLPYNMSKTMYIY